MLMKKILIIGAGEYQLPAIKKIRELGFEAYSVDYKENQPGFEYCNGYEIIDVRNKQRCLQYAERLNIDGVMSWGATLTLPTVSYIGSKLKLPCLPLSTSGLAVNKYETLKYLKENGLNSIGKVFKVNNSEAIEIKNIDYPCVVKPVDGSGSRGVKFVFKENDINHAIKYALNNSRCGEVYIEPYIEGQEFTVEAFASGENVSINEIIKTDIRQSADGLLIYKQTTFEDLTQSDINLINTEIVKAVKLLNVNIGPINFDIIISKKDGKPYIIDVGIRNGQNLIASKIIPYSRGLDELELAIKQSLGIDVEIEPKFLKYVSSRLLIYPPGKITKIKQYRSLIGTNNIIDVILRKRVGDILPPYQTKSDICGWVLCEGASPQNASLNADRAWEKLRDFIIIK